MQITSKEFDAVTNKLNMQVRDSGDRLAWFWHNGKMILMTKRSHTSGPLPCSDKIRQQLKVNEDQMRGLINCPFTLENYIDHLKQKGLISPDSQNPQ